MAYVFLMNQIVVVLTFSRIEHNVQQHAYTTRLVPRPCLPAFALAEDAVQYFPVGRGAR